ncbi:MAG: TonB-dependent receptor [Steroidobacteraceae bacterium]
MADPGQSHRDSIYRKFLRRLLVCASAATLGASTLAAGQEAAPADTRPTVEQTEEIIVTAQKRSERLQDVPISVSAIGGDEIRDLRINTPDDLAATIPNLGSTSTVGEGTPIFSLRGVSMSDFSLNQAPPVATYYDEVYKGNFAFLGVGMFDLERVEVLRGPQGTLYGKNTTGGAINFMSATPKLDSEGSIAVGAGNYGRVEASGMLNAPLGNSAAIRVAGTYTRADGWFKNSLPGEPNLDGVREYGLRTSLLVEPTSNLSFIVRGSTSLQNPYNYGVYGISGPDGIGAGIYEAFDSGTSYFRPSNTDGKWTGALNYNGRREARTYSASLTSKLDLDNGLSIIAVTSYDKGRLSFIEDTDGSPRRVLEIDYFDDANQFAQDLRLASNWTGPFNFILGAYYNHEKVFNETALHFLSDLDVNGDGLLNDQDCVTALSDIGAPFGCSIANRFDQLKKSYALYSDMTYKPSAAITLRAGLRYSQDDGYQLGLRSDAFGTGGGLIQTLIEPQDLSFSKGNLSGKVGIDVKPSRDVLLYGSYSRGYRAPSFNAQAFFSAAETNVAKAETVNAYELGWKTQFDNRRVTFNGAFFYYDYTNQQFLDVQDGIYQRLGNIDKSRIFGAEGDLAFKASEAIAFHGGLGWLSTRINQGVLNGVVLDGNELINAPKLSLNAGLDLTLFHNGSGKLGVHPEVAYVSSQYFDAANSKNLKIGGYSLLNGNIKYEHGPFALSLWAKNLANKFYFTSRIDSQSLGFIYNHVGTPRTFGATATFEF